MLLTAAQLPAHHMPVRSLSTVDRIALARLHRTLRRTASNNFAVRFEREQPRSHIANWQHIVSYVAPNSEAYAETSFALAYYDKDLSRNIQRLLRPQNIQKMGAERFDEEYPEIYSGSDTPLRTNEGIVFCFARLYAKHPKPSLLKTWLDLDVDGHSAEESCEQLLPVWQTHAQDLLRVAHGSEKRLRFLSIVVEIPCSELAFPTIAKKQKLKEYDATLRKLNVLAKNHDTAVAEGATKIAEDVKAVYGKELGSATGK